MMTAIDWLPATGECQSGYNPWMEEELSTVKISQQQCHGGIREAK
jgi:hypothetical protein